MEGMRGRECRRGSWRGKKRRKGRREGRKGGYKKRVASDEGKE
jgi:hypothetical protein